MGVLDRVPFLAGYNEQDQINRGREAQGMQTLGQMMTLQQQQQQMQQAPEDRILKRRLIESQIGENDLKTSQFKDKQARDAETQKMVELWQNMPDTDPMKPILQQKIRIRIDPGNALDPAKTSNLPWYVQRSPDGKTTIDPAYADFEGMKASKGGTKVQMPAPISQIRVMDTDPQSPTYGKPVIKDGRTGRTLGLDSGLDVKAQYDVTGAKETGKLNAETSNSLNAAKSSLPQLEQTVEQLKTLANDATYTMVGRARDAAVTQLGMDATKGAVAREKYIQTVRDVLFPQLRATFGAQFTVKEGEALIATMGDVNKTPQERNVALDAFIEQKKLHVESLDRQARRSTDANPAAIGVPGVRNKAGITKVLGGVTYTSDGKGGWSQ